MSEQVYRKKDLILVICSSKILSKILHTKANQDRCADTQKPQVGGAAAPRIL